MAGVRFHLLIARLFVKEGLAQGRVVGFVHQQLNGPGAGSRGFDHVLKQFDALIHIQASFSALSMALFGEFMRPDEYENIMAYWKTALPIEPGKVII